jgi:Domain of unknown function (DUF1918)
MTPPKLNVGDIVEVGSGHLGEARRVGQIIELLGAPDHPHYRIRWDEQHESIFIPSADASLRLRHAADGDDAP